MQRFVCNAFGIGVTSILLILGVPRRVNGEQVGSNRCVDIHKVAGYVPNELSAIGTRVSKSQGLSGAAFNLAIASTPFSGVSLTLNPSDLNGYGDGPTRFSRQYPQGIVVTLTAPSANGARSFVKWQRNGVDFDTDARTDVTLDGDATMTAVYYANN